MKSLSNYTTSAHLQRSIPRSGVILDYKILLMLVTQCAIYTRL